MTNMMFLTCELDRVGELIDNSRKARDAWLGSYMISYLMARVAVKIGTLFTAPEFLFPDPTHPLHEFVRNGHHWPDSVSPDARRISSVPDRILVKVAANEALENDKTRIKALCTEVEQAWQEIWELSRTAVAQQTPVLANPEEWKAQCEGFFTLHWALTTIDPAQENLSYRRSNEAMAGVNNSRTFQQSWQPGVKCSLCGEYSALPIGKPRGEVKAAWETLSRRNITLVRSTERLSALYAAKRFAGHGKIRAVLNQGLPHAQDLPVGFPSLASLASASFCARLLSGEVDLGALARFQQALGELLVQCGITDTQLEAPVPGVALLAGTEAQKRWLARLDGEWLYEDSYAPAYLEREYNATGAAAAEAATTALQQLKALKRGKSPRPYYALIAMDGDGITAKIAAHYANIHDVTTAMTAFCCDTVPQVVHGQFHGQLIFAGGDEFIAFAPLDEALDIVQAIRDRFTLEGCSISAGIVIAHLSAPLRQAMSMVHDVIGRAKGEKGSTRYGNGVRMLVDKRSGAPVEAGWRFDEPAVFAFIAQTVALRRDGKLGRGFLTDLLGVVELFTEGGGDAVRLEAHRLLKRHKHCPKEERNAPYWQDYGQALDGMLASPVQAAEVLRLADWLAREGQ